MTARSPKESSQFTAVLDSNEFRTELDQIFPMKSQRKPEEVRFQMLRFHHNRCVFDVNLKTDTGWQSIIAKLFTVDRQDAFASMQRIHQSGFGLEAEFAIPRPIAYLSPMRILIEEKVEGSQVKGILLSDDQTRQIEAVRRCGAWLSRFHARAPRFGNRVEPKALLEQIRGWARMVSDFGAPFPAKCEALMKKMSLTVPPDGTFELSPGHGSYIPSHVILCNGRTVTIDFDEFELVDPARDLAWFLIAVERFELKYQKPQGFYERLGGPFLESYLTQGKHDALRFMTFYKAAEYVHRARHDLYKRTPPVPEWAKIMLDQALRGFQSLN